MGDVVKLVGEGGAEFEFELPLDELHRELLQSGKLQPASGSASALLAAASDDEGAGDDSEPSLADRINALSSHAEANELADELGVDGFEDKKPSMAEKKAALLAAASDDDGAGDD